MAKKTKKRLKPIPLLIIKTLLITGILWIFIAYSQDTGVVFSNSAPLLAVNEGEDGEIFGGGVIDLELEIREGSGEIFVNAKPLKEIDTQLSIRNGHNTACEIFELDCNSYDYYYTFKGSSSILQGPSATAMIGMLTAATVNEKNVDPDVTMTGSLNTMGIVGPVSGIPEKIDTAENRGYERVLIPKVTQDLIPENKSITVDPVLDIVDVYNIFTGENFEEERYALDDTNYKDSMSSLVDDICERSDSLKGQLTGNYSKDEQENVLNLSDENRTTDLFGGDEEIEEQLYSSAIDSLNSSKRAIENENFYSASSFCFTANNNLQQLLQIEKNSSAEELLNNTKDMKEEVNEKYDMLSSQFYLETSVNTKNDLYIYLLLLNRLEQTNNYISEIENLNKTNHTQSELDGARNQYALSIERYKTVELWESVIDGQGEEINVDLSSMAYGCSAVLDNIESLSGILRQYGVDVFEDEVDNIREFRNEERYPLCIYNGLELMGNINSVFFSFNIEEEFDAAEELFELTETRIARGDSEDFPIIPYMYYEYSQELFNQRDFQSSMLYLNYAHSFANIDFYLDMQERERGEIIEAVRDEFFTHPLLILALLLLLGFIR